MELCHWDSLQQEQEQAKSPIQKDLLTKKKKIKNEDRKRRKEKTLMGFGPYSESHIPCTNNRLNSFFNSLVPKHLRYSTLRER